MGDLGTLTDHAFSEALQCPLRLEYHRETAPVRPPRTAAPVDIRSAGEIEPDGMAAPIPEASARGRGRHKNAIRTWLRSLFLEAHGLLVLPPPRFEPGDPANASLEPWLRSLPAGALTDLTIRVDGFSGRIPLLFRREGDGWILAQLQGRRWPGHLTRLDPSEPVNRKVERYIWQLAFRSHLLRLAAPGLPVRCELLFPHSGFRSPSDGLFDRLSTGDAIGDDVAAMRDAFVRVDVTEQIALRLQIVDREWNRWRFPEPVSWGGWLDRLRSHRSGAAFQPGRHCASCDYRMRIGDAVGCWQRHGSDPAAPPHSPALHVLDLPGHGNDRLLAEGLLFQEHAPASTSDVEPDAMPPTLTLQWRRDRLIRRLKASTVESQPNPAVPPSHSARPGEFAHPALLNRIRDLAYPLHCIDFEAASFPVPIREGQALYEPVLFQYSCHTIGPDGVVHHQWLDAESAPDPEPPLLQSLLSIDGIHQGTIIHFAPFEHQHLQRMARSIRDPDLKARLRRLLHPHEPQAKPAADPHAANHAADHADHANPANHADHANHADPPHQGPRFFDLSRWLRDYYHHDAMMGGLGLKDLFQALLHTPSSDLLRDMPPQVIGFDPLGAQALGGEAPSAIQNGEEAMQAYLAMRAGLIGPREREDLLKDLRGYCALDTFTMVMAIHRWRELAGTGSSIGR